jgi:hypothetical protein
MPNLRPSPGEPLLKELSGLHLAEASQLLLDGCSRSQLLECCRAPRYSHQRKTARPGLNVRRREKSRSPLAFPAPYRRMRRPCVLYLALVHPVYGATVTVVPWTYTTTSVSTSMSTEPARKGSAPVKTYTTELSTESESTTTQPCRTVGNVIQCRESKVTQQKTWTETRTDWSTSDVPAVTHSAQVTVTQTVTTSHSTTLEDSPAPSASSAAPPQPAPSSSNAAPLPPVASVTTSTDVSVLVGQSAVVAVMTSEPATLKNKDLDNGVLTTTLYTRISHSPAL